MPRKAKKGLKEEIDTAIINSVTDSGLSQKDQDFVLYFLESNNATQSYLKAFGGEKKNASIRGCQIYHRTDIQAELKRQKKLLRIAYDIEPTKYVEFLMKVANANIGDYIKFSEEDIPLIGDDGLPIVNPDTGDPITKKVNRMHLADSELRDTSLITEIKQGRDGISIKLQDQFKAWEKLKEFFEWKQQPETSSNTENSLIKALEKSTDDVWDKDEADNDLEELESANK